MVAWDDLLPLLCVLFITAGCDYFDLAFTLHCCYRDSFIASCLLYNFYPFVYLDGVSSTVYFFQNDLNYVHHFDHFQLIASDL